MPRVMASGCEARDDACVKIRVGMILVAHGRSEVSGRECSRSWLVRGEVHAGMWELVPAPDEPLQVHVIRRTSAELNESYWHVREFAEAPRPTDCAYGCCEAGEVLLYSEVVRAGPSPPRV